MHTYAHIHTAHRPRGAYTCIGPHNVVVVVVAWHTGRYTSAGAAVMARQGELRGDVDVLIVDPPRKGLDEEVLLELERPGESRWVGFCWCVVATSDQTTHYFPLSSPLPRTH